MMLSQYLGAEIDAEYDKYALSIIVAICKFSYSIPYTWLCTFEQVPDLA